MFKNYRRKELASLRPVTLYEADNGFKDTNESCISVSEEDLKAGSPKVGDMIAQNPANTKDQWLVAEKYFKANFEEA